MSWFELVRIFRRREARGEIRGGYFVAGVGGEQFALPAAIASLRAIRRAAPTGELISLSGADPLNRSASRRRACDPHGHAAPLPRARWRPRRGPQGETGHLLDPEEVEPSLAVDRALRVGSRSLPRACRPLLAAGRVGRRIGRESRIAPGCAGRPSACSARQAPDDGNQLGRDHEAWPRGLEIPPGGRACGPRTAPGRSGRRRARWPRRAAAAGGGSARSRRCPGMPMSLRTIWGRKSGNARQGLLGRAGDPHLGAPVGKNPPALRHPGSPGRRRSRAP